MIQLVNDIWGVEVPKKSYGLLVVNGSRPYLSYYTTAGRPTILLPPGNWTIIGKASEFETTLMFDAVKINGLNPETILLLKNNKL